MKDYAAVATQYARDVADGRILACKWVRLAAARHLKDLERAAGGWRYAFNPELRIPEQKDPETGEVKVPERVYRPGDRACYFVELLPHIKGDWAARYERIVLQPWQVFIVCSIFGWVDRESGRRRFRAADLFVPRKNSKSTMAAGIGLYMFAVDGEFGAEVYSGATSEKQAGEVFVPARLMVERTPDFGRRYGITVRTNSLSIDGNNSKFVPIIGKPGDGASPSCAIVDEYHEHSTDDLFATMKSGMGARSQPLILVITTAGDDIAGPCYAHQVTLQAILEGSIEDETRFGIIFTIDHDEHGKPEDWTTETALVKANPNYGVSVDAEFLQGELREALRDPRKQAGFQTKHLNIWVGSASPWLNLQDWMALSDPGLKREQFKRAKCHDGMDLANVTDIADVCTVFKRRESDGQDHFYVFWRHYLPEETIKLPENQHYQGWKAAGWLKETPGSMIDQALIKDDVLADRDEFDLLEVGIDSWGSPGIAAALEAENVTVVRIPQNVAHLSPAMKFIDGLVKAKRIHHDGDPVATWGIGNVEVKPDRNENWFPRRGNRAKKIDPAVALINAMARAMIGDGEASLDDWINSIKAEQLEAGKREAHA